jgi:hypothetical protein
MLSQSRDRRLYDPLNDMNRSSERMFVSLMRPAQGTQRVPIPVGA